MADYTLNLLCGLICFILVGTCEGLRCYQCMDSGGNSSQCENSRALLNQTNTLKPGTEGSWKRNEYYKDCSNKKINYTMCMIEIHSTGGKMKSFHRDCSDGKTFSFTGSAIKLPRLDNLIANNETTCTYQAISNLHICLQLCVGNMCNGPVPPPEVCYNVTGENTTVCGASSLTHFLTHESLNFVFGGLFGYSALLPFLLYIIFILLVV